MFGVLCLLNIRLLFVIVSMNSKASILIMKYFFRYMVSFRRSKNSFYNKILCQDISKTYEKVVQLYPSFSISLSTQYGHYKKWMECNGELSLCKSQAIFVNYRSPGLTLYNYLERFSLRVNCLEHLNILKYQLFFFFF